MLRKLKKHVGSSNLATVTSDEIVGWKDALIASGISFRAIAEGHFAAARSFFNWAIRNRKLTVNPCSGIVIEKEKVIQNVPPRSRELREIGVDDVGIDPNHGWRHRYKTVARRAGMTEVVSDGICGHVKKSIGDTYGEMPIERKWRETVLLPRIEVRPATGDLPDTPARRKRNGDRLATADRATKRTVLKRKPHPVSVPVGVPA